MRSFLGSYGALHTFLTPPRGLRREVLLLVDCCAQVSRTRSERTERARYDEPAHGLFHRVPCPCLRRFEGRCMVKWFGGDRKRRGRLASAGGGPAFCQDMRLSKAEALAFAGRTNFAFHAGLPCDSASKTYERCFHTRCNASGCFIVTH